MSKLKDLGQHCGAMADSRDGSLVRTVLEPMDNALSNRALNTPGIVIGTTDAAEVKITNATMCMVNGNLVLIAAGTEVAFTATTDDITDGYINLFLVTVDADGTLALVGGIEVLIATGYSGVTLPEVSNKKAVIGIVSVATNGAAFDATTTELSAAEVADLFYDSVGPWGLK